MSSQSPLKVNLADIEPDEPMSGSPRQRILDRAATFGLSISSTTRTPERNRAVGGAKNSYHLTAPNRSAYDLTGSPQQLAKFAKGAGRDGGAAEVFYDPVGGFKRGKSIGAIGGHSDHAHVAFDESDTDLRVSLSDIEPDSAPANTAEGLVREMTTGQPQAPSTESVVGSPKTTPTRGISPAKPALTARGGNQLGTAQSAVTPDLSRYSPKFDTAIRGVVGTAKVNPWAVEAAFEREKKAGNLDKAREHARTLQSLGWEAGGLQDGAPAADPYDLAREFEDAKDKGDKAAATRIGQQLASQYRWEFGADGDGNPYVKRIAGSLATPTNAFPYVKPPKGLERPTSQGTESFISSGVANREAQERRDRIAATDRRSTKRKILEVAALTNPVTLPFSGKTGADLAEGAAMGATSWAGDRVAGAGRLIEGAGDFAGAVARGTVNPLGRQPSQPPSIAPRSQGVGEAIKESGEKAASSAREYMGDFGQGAASQAGNVAGELVPDLLVSAATGSPALTFGASSGLSSYGQGKSLAESILTGVVNAQGMEIGNQAAASLEQLAKGNFGKYLIRSGVQGAQNIATNAAMNADVPDTPQKAAKEILFALGFGLFPAGHPKAEEARAAAGEIAASPETHPEVAAEIAKQAGGDPSTQPPIRAKDELTARLNQLTDAEYNAYKSARDSEHTGRARTEQSDIDFANRYFGGEPLPAVPMAFTEQQATLKNLGYDRKTRRAMTPEQAQGIIDAATVKGAGANEQRIKQSAVQDTTTTVAQPADTARRGDLGGSSRDAAVDAVQGGSRRVGDIANPETARSSETPPLDSRPITPPEVEQVGKGEGESSPTVGSLAAKIARGETNFTPEELQLQQNEAGAVEAKLQEMAKEQPFVERRVTEGLPPRETGERRGIGQRIADAATKGREMIARAVYPEGVVDQATGLQNKNQWLRAQARIDADPTREVVVMDVNDLKKFNDKVSHAAGDEYLAHVGQVAIEEGAKLGISPRQIYRFGGDEIHIDAPAGKGQELLAAIKSRVAEFERGEAKGSVAGGVAQTTAEADAAMYKDKAAMKGGVPAEEKSYHHSQDQNKNVKTGQFELGFKEGTRDEPATEKSIDHSANLDSYLESIRSGESPEIGVGDTGRFYDLGNGYVMGQVESSARQYKGKQVEFAEGLAKTQNQLAEMDVTVPRRVLVKTYDSRKGSIGYPDGRVPFAVSEKLTNIQKAESISDLPEPLRSRVQTAKDNHWLVNLDKGEWGYDKNGEPKLVDVSEWAFKDWEVSGKLSDKKSSVDTPPSSSMGVEPDAQGRGGGTSEVKERSFPKTLEAADLAGGNDRIYRVVGNEESVATARNNLSSKGVDGAAEFVRNSKDPSAEVTATGIAVIDEYQRQALAETDKTKKAELYQKANDVAGDLSAKLTKAGQAIQAAKLVEEFGTSQAVLSAQRIAEKRGKKLTSQQTEEITKSATALVDATKRIRELEDIVAAYDTKKETAKSKRKAAVKKGLDEAAVAARERLAKLTQKPDSTTPRTSPTEQGAVSLGRRNVPDSTVADLAAVQAAKVHAGDKSLAEIRKEMSTEFGADYDAAYRRVEKQADALLKSANRQQESVLPQGKRKPTARQELGKSARESSKWDADIKDEATANPDDIAAQGAKLLTDNIEAKAGRRVWEKEMSAKFGKEFDKHKDSIYVESYGRIKAAKKAHADYREILRAHKEGAVTDEQIAIVHKRLAEARERHRNANLDLAQQYDRLAGGRWWNIVSGVRKAGLLSSVRTHLRNFISNTAYQTFDEVSRLPAVVVDFATSGFTKQRAITRPNFTDSFRSMYAGLTIGGKELGHILKHGVTPEQAAKLQIPQELNSGVKVVDTAANTVFRLMSGVDRVFYQGSLKRNTLDRAKVQAINEFREGKIKYRDVASRTREIVKLPSDELVANAKHDALVATFNNSNKLSDAIRRARSSFSAPANFAIDLIMPFDRTPTNVVMRTLEASPLGYGKAAKIAAKSIMNKAMSVEEQRQFSQTMGRATAGTAIMTLGFILGSKGLMSAFYDEDDDYQSRKENRKLKEQGKSPMALKVGDQWVSVGDTNIGNMLAIGATLQKEMAEAKGDRAKQGVGILKTGKNVLLEQPLLSSAKDIVKSADDLEGKGSDYGGRLLSSFIPAAGLVRDIAGAGDSKARKTFGFKGQMYSSIPGLRNTLPEDPGVQHRRTWAIDPFRMKTDRASGMQGLGRGGSR